jgi:hypothetical protein
MTMQTAVRIDLTGLRHRPAHTSGRNFTTPHFQGTARRGAGRSATLYTVPATRERERGPASSPEARAAEAESILNAQLR